MYDDCTDSISDVNGAWQGENLFTQYKRRVANLPDKVYTQLTETEKLKTVSKTYLKWKMFQLTS